MLILTQAHYEEIQFFKVTDVQLYDLAGSVYFSNIAIILKK